MRAIYRRRRDTLLGAFSRHLPAFEPCGASAGLHVLAWLPSEIDEQELLHRATHASVGLVGLTSTRLLPGGRGGLVFGYGSVDERQIEEGVVRLAQIVADMNTERLVPRTNRV